MNETKQAAKQEASDIIKNYTRTPNILFESYPGLHPQDKWLYINLVYLCGSKGTRHLSLRYIADRTGISVGALSGPKKGEPGMIRRLHDAGLIHAETKKRDGKGQSQYHITITNIWQLNLDFFLSRKCSEYEQSNDECVQNMNDSVQNVNTSSQERSQYEQERSHFDTKVILQSKTTDIGNTTEQEDSVQIANASALSARYAQNVDNSVSDVDEVKEQQETLAVLIEAGKVPQSALPIASTQETTRKRSARKSPDTEPLAPKVITEPPADMPWGTRKCLQWFDYRRGSLLITDHKIREASKCAKGLAAQFTEEQVKQAVKNMEASDYWAGKTFDICNVANNISSYLTVKKPAPATNGARPTALVSEEQSKKNKERLRERAIANGYKPL